MEQQPTPSPKMNLKKSSKRSKVSAERLAVPLLLLGPLAVGGIMLANETQGDHTYTNCVVSNPNPSAGWDAENPIKTSCGDFIPSMKNIFDKHMNTNAQMSQVLFSGKPVTIKATGITPYMHNAYEVTITDQ